MSIQVINSGNSHGLQVRVFRNSIMRYSAFFAFKKYGGEAAAMRLALIKEAELERKAGQKVRSRRFGEHSDIPNKNNKSSGIPGIRAIFDTRNGRQSLQFVASWVDRSGETPRARRLQYSANHHGVLNRCPLTPS